MTDTVNEAQNSAVVERLHELINNMTKNDQHALLSELEERLAKGKREHERKPFLTTVDYSTESGAYRDFIKDISHGGVFIETHTPHLVGDNLSMVFLLSGHEKRLKIQGEIVRIEPKGIGVKFKASQVQKEIIKSFVDKV